MSFRRQSVLLAIFTLAATGTPLVTPLAAQQVDVIRGRVVGPDSLPLEGVNVTATSLSGAVNRKSRTDRGGRFTITFPGGEGDYFVSFALIGYAQKRFEVKRTADQDILVADAKLSRAAELDAVRVTAPRDRVGRTDANSDVSGTERAINPAALAAAQMGDLAAMAASLPGVTLVPGADGDPSGFSVLGLGSDQNNTTLNGQNFGGANLPRDAAVSSSLATSPYDVSSGGFSGAQFRIRTQPGSNFIRRTMSLNVDSPHLQWTDKAAQALGQKYSNLSLGGLFAGPVKLDQSFYTLSYQLGRRSSDLQTLLNTDPLGLRTTGIAADSVARLLAILQRLRIPATTAAVPSNKLTDQGSLLATFDIAPQSSKGGTAVNLTANGSWNRSSPISALSTELPGHSGDRTNWSGGLSTRHSTYFDIGVLSETTLGFSESQSYGSPYLVLPTASVRISSTFADGTNGLKNIQFGGNPFLSTTSQTTTTAFTNQLSWFSENNKHRLKLATEFRRDDFDQDQTTNRFGSFTYNSLADLENGKPASYSRQLSPRVRSGGQYVGAISLGDSYKRSSDLQVQYGVRLDGNSYVGLPTRNTQLETVFGTRNDVAPNRIYASPRLGFSWTYGTAPQIGGFEGAMRGPRAVVRGGVGMFQNTPATTMLGTAIDNTGLANAIQQVTCTGFATPMPNWAGYVADPRTVPSQCADGTASSIFANSAPNVTFFANNYAAQRSLRSNLQWSGAAIDSRFNVTAEVTYSLNLDQPGSVDLNFAPTQRFALAGEGGRPVFVLPSSIDQTTGAIASRDARVTSLYNRVNEMRSDLKSESKQFTLRVSPMTFNTVWSWGLSYVYSTFRDQQRGFSSTVGNPLTTEWARSNFDSHHQIQYSLGYNFFDAVRVNWTGNFRSGSPYTPVVAGDINGDGYGGNDRAFIADPAKTADPALASAMQQLLSNAPSAVRSCLTSQLGTLAGRSSCEGPWTQSANLSVSFNPLKLGLPQRAQLSLAVSNPLGAADLMLHGENNLRGWGQTPFPDNQLLYVRGFDPAARRFKYDVNQRFGNTNPAFSPVRSPVVVTAMLRFDIGPTREEQSLVQQINSGRRTQGIRLTESVLRQIYGTTGSLVNPMAMILRQADTLNLTGPQADSIATLNRWYTVRLDSIWTPVTKYLGSLPDRYDADAAYARYKKAREASVDLLIKISNDVKGTLTPAQRRKLPDLVNSYLEPRYLAGIRSGTAGAGGSAFGAGGPMAMQMGGGGSREMIIVR